MSSAEVFPFAASSSEMSWRGTVVSIVPKGRRMVRYEGVLCHVDEVGRRIFLGRVRRFLPPVGVGGGGGRGDGESIDLSDKLLVVSGGQVESIEILDLTEEEDEEDGSSLSSASSVDEPDLEVRLEDDDVEASQVLEDEGEARENVAESSPEQQPTEKEPSAAIENEILTIPEEPSEPAPALISWSAAPTTKTAELKKRIPLPMNKQMVKKCPRVFPDYYVPLELARILEHKLERYETMTVDEKETLDCVKGMFQDGMNLGNYKHYLTFLLYAEEWKMEQSLENFDMYNAKVRREPPNHPVSLRVPGLVDKNPNVIKGDTICLLISQEWFDLTVLETFGEEVHFERNKEFETAVFTSKAVTERYCDVQFTVNQSCLRCMHRAIGILHPNTIGRLFPIEAPRRYKGISEDIVLFNSSINDNEEQKQAVQHILSRSSWPYPYILFGPPGTGKSVTIVEAVKQVWKTIPSSRIVVSAPSNTAADLLASMLIGDVGESAILRLVAPAREGVEVDASIENIVCYGRIRMEKLLSYRIVVVTLSTAGRLYSSGLKVGHFSHIFIDEAGQATEPETLVPLAGLLSNNGHIVLSGDPCQLGPVTTTDFGLDKSLLERLMNTCSIYQRDSNGNRDKNVITKLLRNFRSHEKLLTLPSRLFYDNELVACARSKEVESLCNLHWVPKPGFPIIFHGVVRKHQKGSHSTSLFNDREIEVVMRYVARLTDSRGQHSIGIVSPYRLQVRKIKEELERQLNLTDVLVGSTEEFQGQERDVMIVSTVRSSMNGRNGEEGGGLGFLVHAKRFNVAITRAKGLMIVVGDPYLLSRNKYWHSLLRYAVNEGGYTGCDFSFSKVDKKSRRKRK